MQKFSTLFVKSTRPRYSVVIHIHYLWYKLRNLKILNTKILHWTKKNSVSILLSISKVCFKYYTQTMWEHMMRKKGRTAEKTEWVYRAREIGENKRHMESELHHTILCILNYTSISYVCAHSLVCMFGSSSSHTHTVYPIWILWQCMCCLVGIVKRETTPQVAASI